MNWFKVILAVACGATFDTGERIETRVLASDKLDAAIRAEAEADKRLINPAIEYTHAKDVMPLNGIKPTAMALAA
jgi:hypothetical protein